MRTLQTKTSFSRQLSLRLTKTSLLLILFSLLVIIGGFVLVSQLSKTSQLSASISGYALEEGNALTSPDSFLFSLLYGVLGILLLVNAFVFVYLRRTLDTLRREQKEVGQKLALLKEGKNDEIREMVTTRNVLLDTIKRKQ